MPKVSEQYFIQKKQFIIDCVRKVYERKHLYQITMRDIIKETGYSQGAIYRYYKSLDEIYLDLINRCIPQIALEDQIDSYLTSNKNPSEIVMAMICTMGNYIMKVREGIGGKMYFEFILTYAHDEKRGQNILSRIKYQNTCEIVKKKCIAYICEQIEEGIFKPILPLEYIIKYMEVGLDGIGITNSLESIRRMDKDYQKENQELSKMLAQSILKFLGK